MSRPIIPIAVEGASRQHKRQARKGRRVDAAALAEVQVLLGNEPTHRDLLIEFLHRINRFSSVGPSESAENIDLTGFGADSWRHPIGERKLALKLLAEVAEQALVEALGGGDEEEMRASTPGGVFHIRWDDRSGATAMRQLPFLAEYLNAAGLFENWIRGRPLSCVSPNAPRSVDVLGTWMLSILDGHYRYAHVGMLRGDGVAPSILGLKKIIGDDSLTQAIGLPVAHHGAGADLQYRGHLARAPVRGRIGCTLRGRFPPPAHVHLHRRRAARQVPFNALKTGLQGSVRASLLSSISCLSVSSTAGATRNCSLQCKPKQSIGDG